MRVLADHATQRRRLETREGQNRWNSKGRVVWWGRSWRKRQRRRKRKKQIQGWCCKRGPFRPKPNPKNDSMLFVISSSMPSSSFLNVEQIQYAKSFINQTTKSPIGIAYGKKRQTFQRGSEKSMYEAMFGLKNALVFVLFTRPSSNISTGCCWLE